MSDRRKKVRDQSGKEVEGVVVDVAESTERFSDIRLQDGTLIRIKPVVVEAVRVDGQWDKEGNPLYVLRSGNVVVVDDVRDDLKRGPMM